MSKGFTLFEVLIAIVVIGIGLLGILLVNTYLQSANEAAYERTVAMQDAHRVIERIRSASASGTFPTNVTSVFPSGNAVAGFGNLTGEQVTVSYPDAEADPLDVTVTTNWLERGSRNASVQLRTLITRRQ